MELTAAQIAQLFQGRLRGDGTVIIRGAAGLSEAGPHDVSFVKDEGHSKGLAATKAGAVIVPEGFRPEGLQMNGRTLIESKHPLSAFAKVLEVIAKEQPKPPAGVHPQACVSEKARMGRDVSVGPFSIVEEGAELEDGVCLMGQVYIGRNARVGRDSQLYPHVVLREGVRIGARCIIHAGAVIGSDGYGFYFSDGKHNKIPQIGAVIVEDDVEIGSCTTIDRATTGATFIRQGAKIDNLVQVAHNVEVGAHSLLVAQAGIAGSSRLGKGVVIAGQVGVADHVNIGDGAQIGAQSGLKDDVPAGAVMFGSPAQRIHDTIKQLALLKRLPELFKDVRKLKDKYLNND